MYVGNKTSGSSSSSSHRCLEKAKDGMGRLEKAPLRVDEA